MNDPYKTLGVSRTADQAEIKSAYRKLAKKYHPDLNPGDADVERRFKDVSAAYDVLGDSAKRAKFDRGEFDAGGRDRSGTGSGFWRNWNRRSSAGADSSSGTRTRFDFGEDFENESDPIDEILKAWRSSKPNQGAGDPQAQVPGTARPPSDHPRIRDTD